MTIDFPTPFGCNACPFCAVFLPLECRHPNQVDTIVFINKHFFCPTHYGLVVGCQRKVSGKAKGPSLFLWPTVRMGILGELDVPNAMKSAVNSFTTVVVKTCLASVRTVAQ